MHIKTIIIGGGVAGLMCAHELEKKGYKDFVIITKDLGGRVISSKNQTVNYGAYFVTKEYKQLWRYLRLGREMKKQDFGFVHNGEIHSLFSRISFMNMGIFIRLYFSLLKFRRKFRIFRKRCISMSQKEALEKDPYLLALYHRKGSEIIHEFKALALVREYFDQLGNFMSFGYPGNTNAFSLMQWASEMLSLRMYEFHLDITKLTKELKKKIVYGEVIGIKKTKTTYIVDTKDRQYQADNVVVATEPWVTRELIQLDSTSPILMSAYVRHVMGIPSKQIKSTHFTYILFPSKSGIISINRQADGSYLIYTDSKDISIDKYFESHEIIYERPWDPAFIFSSKELIEAKHDKGLYLIGGINIESMEDCATTGIWAARQILRSQLSL